ncbi:MAG: hypothetical protein LRY63_11695 [Nitrincola sp.]|nr:hypothetical protein [Nitrincola sp.]
MLLFCRQQLHKNRFFVSVVFILGLLFISVALFIEHRNTQHLEAQLLLEAESFRNGFELSQKDLQQQMLLVATLLAENTRVQTLFYQGQQAFIREAGDSNGAETTYWRSALLQYMASRWQLMQSEFGMRQLQFHLVPEVTSFLRVHQPDLFGDSLRGIRPIVEDVLLDQHPRSGFETGRIYSGVRGVVPVYANLPFHAPQLIGSLEVGTSFDAQLMRLDEQYNAGFAVLLRQEHVDDQVWQRFQNLKGLALPEGCECYTEAYTRDTIIDLLGLHRSSNLTANQIESVLVELSDQLFHLIRFPLFDYATDEKQTSPVGSVWIWQEKTELASLLQQSRVHTRLMLLVTFLMAVASVAWVLRLTRRKLIEKNRCGGCAPENNS